MSSPISNDALAVKVENLKERVDNIEADYKIHIQRFTDAVISIEKNTATTAAFMQTQAEQIKILVEKQEKTEDTLNQVNTDLQSMKARYDANLDSGDDWISQLVTKKGIIIFVIVLALFALGFNHEQIIQFLGM